MGLWGFRIAEFYDDYKFVDIGFKKVVCKKHSRKSAKNLKFAHLSAYSFFPKHVLTPISLNFDSALNSAFSAAP
jgi:hypothetical protein